MSRFYGSVCTIGRIYIRSTAMRPKITCILHNKNGLTQPF